ncbi:beta-N-acetylhexosaminidase [Georgenia soli]|uniref:beta-N-acetylhexosaminidase n=1 Tax=Georgenia soli TaxID=638953 RepID=A0A2A9EI84_9MICO|nr:glycoside hydrolase family 3 N-terminal domain-containing protein [Georgenia soli]PFG37969.1 beta-N-acetylhexosaminidase [Georgenia soli]
MSRGLSVSRRAASNQRPAVTRRRALVTGAAGLAAAALLAACSASVTPAGEGAGTSPPPGPTATVPQEPANAWGPGAADVAEATADAAELSDAELAGQLIVGRLHGTDPATAEDLVTELHLAGVMVTGDSVASLEQVRALSEGVHDAVAADGRDWPGVVSTDNEGGTVQRMSGRVGPWTTFPSFATAGRAAAAGETRLVREAHEAMARELRASGVTVNWAPVADVTVPDQDVTIGSRAAGEDPGTVGAAIVPAVQGLLGGGVLASVKHFPGHGSLTTDSHLALPVHDGTADEIARRELPPFAEAVEAGVPMVMVAHVDVRAWDPGVPASLSREAYRILREDLDFAGVTVTDSLGMGALAAVGDAGDVAVAALGAGADLLLNPADNAVAHAGVVEALQDGTLDRERLEQSAGRVIAMMRYQARLAEEAGPPGEVGDGARAAQALQHAGG